MTSHDTVEEDRGPCFCGAGRVIRETVSYNQMYGGTDSRLYISCGACNALYVIERNGKAFKKEALEAYSLTATEHRRLSEGIQQDYCHSIANQLEKLARAAGRTKAIWDSELSKYGISRPVGANNLHSHLRNAVNVENVERIAGLLGRPHDAAMRHRIDKCKASGAGLKPPESIAWPSTNKPSP